MESACYTMALYCDAVLPTISGCVAGQVCEPGKQHIYKEFPHDFTGRTYADVKRQAMRLGWKWTARGHLCPRCARAGVKLPKIP